MSMRKKRHFGDEESDEEDNNLFYRQASVKQLSKASKLELNVEEPVAQPEAPPSEQPCLPYIQAIMFACVLEDAITQLRILAECNNQLSIIKIMADIDILRAKKYQVKQGRNKDDLSGITSKNLGCMQFKLDKLVADRIYFTDVLVQSYLELSLDRCFSSLTESNNEVENKDVYRLNLIEEEARNRTARRELMKQLRQQRIHIKSVAYDTDLIIDQLKSKVEDAALNSEIRGRYINNWQRARTEQHKQTIHDKEAGPSGTIYYYQNRTDQEQRIHSEVELLVNIFINETLTKVENWMNKYDHDMEAIDLKIAIMKNKYQDEINRRELMEEAYAEHEVLMKNWIQYKTDREKVILYKEKMQQSAIVVQAWWRGLLVRLELGPYKPKKGGGVKPPPKPKTGKKK